MCNNVCTGRGKSECVAGVTRGARSARADARLCTSSGINLIVPLSFHCGWCPVCPDSLKAVFWVSPYWESCLMIGRYRDEFIPHRSIGVYKSVMLFGEGGVYQPGRLRSSGRSCRMASCCVRPDVWYVVGFRLLYIRCLLCKFCCVGSVCKRCELRGLAFTDCMFTFKSLPSRHTTWNPRVIGVENWLARVPLKIKVYSTWISSCVLIIYWCWLHVDIKWSLNLICLRVIHVAFLMWIIGVHFQVYSTWIVSHEIMMYPFTRYQMDIMWRMPPDFVSHVFHVYFSQRLLVYLSTCISGG